MTKRFMQLALIATVLALGLVVSVPIGARATAQDDRGLEVELNTDLGTQGFSPIRPRIDDDVEVDINIEIEDAPRFSEPRPGTDTDSIATIVPPVGPGETREDAVTQWEDNAKNRPRSWRPDPATRHRDFTGQQAFSWRTRFMSQPGFNRWRHWAQDGYWISMDQSAQEVRSGGRAIECPVTSTPQGTITPAQRQSTPTPRQQPAPSRRNVSRGTSVVTPNVATTPAISTQASTDTLEGEVRDEVYEAKKNLVAALRNNPPYEEELQLVTVDGCEWIDKEILRVITEHEALAQCDPSSSIDTSLVDDLEGRVATLETTVAGHTNQIGALQRSLRAINAPVAGLPLWAWWPILVILLIALSGGWFTVRHELQIRAIKFKISNMELKPLLSQEPTEDQPEPWTDDPPPSC